jgi:hypothetical protein
MAELSLVLSCPSMSLALVLTIMTLVAVVLTPLERMKFESRSGRAARKPRLSGEAA